MSTEPEKEETKVDPKDAAIAALKEELKKAKEESESWKNKYYMAFADTQNLRKSLEEDHRNALRYRAEGFLEALLPALDSFHIALSAEPNGEEAKNYRQGFNFIYNQIQSALEAEGVREVAPKEGADFDPRSMHAIDTVPHEDGKEGKVAKVFSKGYYLYDRLVSPAKVAVYAKATKKEADAGAKDPHEEEHKA